MGVRSSGGARRWQAWAALGLLALGCGRTSKTIDNYSPGSGSEPQPDPDPDAAPLPSSNCGVSLAGGAGRHCAVYQDGSVWCWGVQAPDGPSNFEPSDEPLHVVGIAEAERVIVGPRHSCAIMSSQWPRCWGENESGQIHSSDDLSPVTWTPLDLSWSPASPLKGLSIGDLQTCALNYFSHAYCRGTDASGERDSSQQVVFPGPPDTTMPGSSPYLIDDRGLVYPLLDWSNPTAVPLLGDDNAWYSGAGVPSCVLKRTGSLWCTSSELGETQRLVAQPQLGERVEQAGVGKQFWCALSDGQVWCEGRDDLGQTASGRPHERSAGHFIDGLRDVRAISVNDSSGCALKGDGSVWCWGQYGPTAQSAAPEQVSDCVNQTREPNDLPPLHVSVPPVGAHLAEAGLARGQALCTCATGGTLEDSCADAENFAPNAACISALAPTELAHWECRAQALWQEAECYANQACPGNAQLESCSRPDCPPSQFPGIELYCRRSACALDQEARLTKAQICDGVVDCADGSDERNCAPDADRFECPSGDSISLDQLCDAVVDCDDGSDEQFCHH